MNIYIKLKSLGNRRPVLDNVPYVIPDGIDSLRLLLESIVRSEVTAYNNRGTDSALVPFLTESEIADRSVTGKVGFGRLYSDKKADPVKAVNTALLAFEDGLVRVLINDREICDLDEALVPEENDVITFIRLTFLAGRLW